MKSTTRLGTAIAIVLLGLFGPFAHGATRSEILQWLQEGQTEHYDEIVKQLPSIAKPDIAHYGPDLELLGKAPSFSRALIARQRYEDRRAFEQTVDRITHDLFNRYRSHGGRASPGFFDLNIPELDNYYRTVKSLDEFQRGEIIRLRKEAERAAREKAEAERVAREESERAAREKAEAERVAREEAERAAREAELAERKKAEAERKAREKAERAAREKAEAERKIREIFNFAEGFVWADSEEGVRLLVPPRKWVRWSWTGAAKEGLADGTATLRVRKRNYLPFMEPDAWDDLVSTNYHRGVPAGLAATPLSSDGTFFHGSVKDGKPRGFGILLLGRRSIVGTFRNSSDAKGDVSVFEGDDEVYRGGWKNGKYDGKGILRLADGETFEGSFRAGRKHGAGVFVRHDGTREVGVFRNGVEDETVTEILSRLDSRETAVDADGRFRIAQRVFWHHSNRLWVNALLCVLFASPIAFLRRMRKVAEIDAERCLESPLDVSGLARRCIFGGFLGLHKIKTLNRLWIVYPALSSIWLMFNVSNVYRAVTNPSVGFALWRTPAGAWISLALLAALIVFDFAVGIRYDVYRFNAKYWRATNAAFAEDAIETACLVPAKVEECIAVAKDGLAFLKERNDESVGSQFSDWFSNGKIEREREKLAELEQAYDAVVEKSLEYAGEARGLETELFAARLTAMRNFKLAKEIFSHYNHARVKGRADEMVVDDLALEELETLSLDVGEAKTIEVPPFDFDGLRSNVSGFFQGGDRALSGLAKLSGDDADDDDVMDGAANFVGGLFSAGSNLLQGARAIGEHYRQKKEIERLIVSAQSRIVEAADEACRSLLNNKAKVLRAAEIVKALAKCNKAFIRVYAGLRDDVFGRISFETFKKGEDALADSFMERNASDRTFVGRLGMLKQVCSDYKKVSLAEIESTGGDAVPPGPAEKNSEANASESTKKAIAFAGSEPDVADGNAGTGDGGNLQDLDAPTIPNPATAKPATTPELPPPAVSPALPLAERNANEVPLPAETSSERSTPDQDVRPPLRSVDFVAAGIFTGWLGLHLAYVARWTEFAVSTALAVFAVASPAMGMLPLAVFAMIAWWIATFFIVKTDGKGRKLRTVIEAMTAAAGGDLINLVAMTPKEQKAFGRKVKKSYYAPTCPDRSPCNRIVYILLSLLVGATGLNNLYIRSRREGRVSIALLAMFAAACIPNAMALGDEWAGLLAMPCAAMFLWNVYCAFFVTEDGRGRRLRWF